MKIYGAKRQKQSSHKPYIQKDTASSTNFIKHCTAYQKVKYTAWLMVANLSALMVRPLSMIMASQTFLMCHGIFELAVLTKRTLKAFRPLKMSKVSM